MNLKRSLIVLITINFIAGGLFFLPHIQAQTALTTISGKFYKLDVLGANGQNGVGTLNINGGSVNDFGTVAFGSSTGLYTADGRNPLRLIRSGSLFPPYINNQNLLVAQRFNFQLYIDRYDINPPNPLITEIANNNGTNFFNIANPSINRDGQVAFGGVLSGQTQLATGAPGSYNRQFVTGDYSTHYPVVADNGSIVAGIGSTTTAIGAQAIQFYPNYNFSGASINIASVGTTFTRLGRRPGISDDGDIIVFYGETADGPGIFASYAVSGVWQPPVRIARRPIENNGLPSGNKDSVCDPGETCLNAQLGANDARNTLFFNSFETDARVGVVHQSSGATGLPDDVFVVSFIGTPNLASSTPEYFSAQKGLWTIRVDLKLERIIAGTTELLVKPASPIPVVQVGDLIGTGNQISDITVNDPIALAANDDNGNVRTQRLADHRVVFTANTQAGGRILVRGSRLDSDEDNLPDHWETSGIDFNQDGGTPDLQLNAAPFNANPNRKDVFVEIDYMEGGGHTHRPGYLPNNSGPLNAPDPLTQVRNAFAASPVSNPDNSTGITLHTFVDEALPEIRVIQFGNRRPGANDDFLDLKFGSNGTPVGNLCGTSLTDGHFGTRTDRMNAANCQNILGARRLAFRYTIFGHRASFAPTSQPLDQNEPTYGVSETPGDDTFLVLYVNESADKNDAEDIAKRLFDKWKKRTGTTFDAEFADLQAGVFMHEFGHALGLSHGGNDRTNCKPNYLSVMSYSRAINQGGKATGTLAGVSRGAKVRLNRQLDYSRAVLPPPPLNLLNEASLFETAGINGPAGERTIHGNPGDSKPIISGTDGPIDWNNNGSVQSTAINADINRINTDPTGLCSATVPNEPLLRGYNDWANLRYNFYNTLSFSLISGYVPNIDGPELGAVGYLNGGLGSTDEDEDSVLNQNDNCIFAPNADQADSNSNGIGNACDAATTVLADLFVTLADSSDPASINTAFNYVATIGNDGPSAAQSVTFTDQLPTGVTFNSVTPSQGSCSGTSSITCNLGTINNGATATVTIRVTPTIQGKIDNFVNVRSGTVTVPVTADPNIDNNDSAASTTVVNSAITYTISGRVTDASNNGLAGILITVSGGQTVFTDSTGNYSVTVASGGTYTIAPSRFGFAFSPPARTVAYIAANQTVNFTGTRAANAVTKRADFDGDGKTDISSYRSSNNLHYILNSSTQTTTTQQWGLTTDKRVGGDFDGDGRSDFAVFRQSNTNWYILRSSDNTLFTIQWGLGTDIPVAGDYDADGKTDVAVWRPSNGSWYIRRSSDLVLLTIAFGQNNDVPLVGDFDGDGKTDFVVFRPSDTTWYFSLSNGGIKQAQFGLTTDKLVPADYDGDGKTDFAIWRASMGQWYFAPATEPDPSHHYSVTTFGVNGDVPAPGDYDGDGKDDRAVFRPSNATWYVLRSSDQTVVYTTFGQNGDLPLPTAYLPQ